MTIKMPFRDAFEAVPPEIREEVRSTLLALSATLFELHKKVDVFDPTTGMFTERRTPFDTWARLFWLQAYLNLGPNGVFTLLKSIDTVSRDLRGEPTGEAVKSVETARQALFAFIDYVREHVT